MLFRQHLRRRDEHRLFAGADGLHHSRHRDHGFAGADLALQQALHGVITCHIVGNIGVACCCPSVSENGSDSTKSSFSRVSAQAVAVALRDESRDCTSAVWQMSASS